jgi:hypothetical protein
VGFEEGIILKFKVYPLGENDVEKIIGDWANN